MKINAVIFDANWSRFLEHTI